MPYGKLVKLSFTAFDVEWSSSCDEDYVQIYDGWSSASEVKTKLCGASLPSDVSSTSRYLRVQFRSDEDNHGNCSGFKAQFEQVHKASKSTLHTAWLFVVTNIINQLNKDKNNNNNNDINFFLKDMYVTSLCGIAVFLLYGCCCCCCCCCRRRYFCLVCKHRWFLKSLPSRWLWKVSSNSQK